MNNNIVLKGCINEFKKQNELDIHDSEIFELFSLTQSTKNIDLCFDDLEDSIVNDPKNGGIHSIIIILDDDYISSLDSINDFKFNTNTTLKIIFSLAKTEKSFKESSIDKLISSFPILLDLEQDENTLSHRFHSSIVSKTLVLHDVWQKTLMNAGKIK